MARVGPGHEVGAGIPRLPRLPGIKENSVKQVGSLAPEIEGGHNYLRRTGLGQAELVAGHNTTSKHPQGKLGSGERFKAVEASARASGADNPAAVAAAVGRKKYGAKKMAAMAAAGRRRSK